MESKRLSISGEDLEQIKMLANSIATEKVADVVTTITSAMEEKLMRCSLRDDIHKLLGGKAAFISKSIEFELNTTANDRKRTRLYDKLRAINVRSFEIMKDADEYINSSVALDDLRANACSTYKVASNFLSKYKDEWLW